VSLCPSTTRPFNEPEFFLTLRCRNPTRGHCFARVSYTVSTLLLAHFGDFTTPRYRGATVSMLSTFTMYPAAFSFKAQRS
jgi:hypothetical protein